MAVIYLKHPIHGAKVAISDMEAEADMQNGWEEFDPTATIKVSVTDPAPEPTTNALQPRRRGRPPREAA